MAELNALTMDIATGAVSIPVGATGWYIVMLNTTASLDIAVDKAILGVATRTGASPTYRYTQVFRRDYPIQVDAEGKFYVKVELSNAETRVLNPGSYYWDLIIVTDPAEDPVTGKAIVDETTDKVYPVYAVAGALPSFLITGGVLIV